MTCACKLTKTINKNKDKDKETVNEPWSGSNTKSPGEEVNINDIVFDARENMSFLIFDLTAPIACYARRTATPVVSINGVTYHAYFDNAPYMGRGVVCVPGVRIDSKTMVFPEVNNTHTPHLPPISLPVGHDAAILPAGENSSSGGNKAADTVVFPDPDLDVVTLTTSTPEPGHGSGSALEPTKTPGDWFAGVDSKTCMDLDTCLKAQRAFANQLRQELEAANAKNTWNWLWSWNSKTLTVLLGVSIFVLIIIILVVSFIR
jgi:hypothetical protein